MKVSTSISIREDIQKEVSKQLKGTVYSISVLVDLLLEEWLKGKVNLPQLEAKGKINELD